MLPQGQRRLLTEDPLPGDDFIQLDNGEKEQAALLAAAAAEKGAVALKATAAKAKAAAQEAAAAVAQASQDSAASAASAGSAAGEHPRSEYEGVEGALGLACI